MQGKPLNHRYSRHFYDFYKLYTDATVRSTALSEKNILSDVVRFKKRWFHAPKARYEEALEKKLKLTPPPSLIPDLEKDYTHMRDMFISEPPKFEDIISVLARAEAEINQVSH